MEQKKYYNQVFLTTEQWAFLISELTLHKVEYGMKNLQSEVEKTDEIIKILVESNIVKLPK